MRWLVTNALGYLKTEHGLVDPASGYPVEGWNQDPEQGLYLRSFTQLTSIGERLELLADIGAGYADNPYISREQALDGLEHMVTSLLDDQSNPTVSDRGLLVNFLGFAGDNRTGPLGEEVQKSKFIEAFGKDRASSIWEALVAKKWIIPQQDGAFAKISRKGQYGDKYFSGELAPFSDSATCASIMSILDERDVLIIFGDNANLTASAAKAIGALLHPALANNPRAELARQQLEQFITRQEPGYRHLYDEKSGLFLFGWNATHERFTGWEDSNGKWIVGHMDYLVNEFRGPLEFVVQRFDLPRDAVRNSGIKIKPYRTADGRDLYSLATWNGSAFESLGLSLFMQELEYPGWEESLENAVAIELDYSTRHRLPGLLSEAYSGNGVEYTGNIGIPELAVTNQPRITDAPSLYMLGTAYVIAPDNIDAFIAANRPLIAELLTDHGPWEGYNTTDNAVIRFQTTGHTLALILGGTGAAEENMARYRQWRGLTAQAQSDQGTTSAFDFLKEDVSWISWSPTGDQVSVIRSKTGARITAASVLDGAVTLKTPGPAGTNLSNGALLIRYRSTQPLDAIVTLNAGPKLFPNEIFTRFDATTKEKSIRIPLPATPGLEGVTELVMRFGNRLNPLSVDLSISAWEFLPAR
ncbi:MAG: hypothetical protein R3E50_00575 [Halioglobus sp.]